MSNNNSVHYTLTQVYVLQSTVHDLYILNSRVILSTRAVFVCCMLRTQMICQLQSGSPQLSLCLSEVHVGPLVFKNEKSYTFTEKWAETS